MMLTPALNSIIVGGISFISCRKDSFILGGGRSPSEGAGANVVKKAGISSFDVENAI